MGLVTANTVGLSGLVAPKPNVQIFASTATWTKPAGCTRIFIEVVGGGGGGSRGESAGGPGGGGGAYVRGIYDAAALPSTLTMTVGAAGVKGDTGTSYVGGTGGTSSAGLADYSEGGFSLIAYGGGGGPRPNGVNSSGGSGGGTGGAGTVGNNSAIVAGGTPTIQGSGSTGSSL